MYALSTLIFATVFVLLLVTNYMSDRKEKEKEKELRRSML